MCALLASGPRGFHGPTSFPQAPFQCPRSRAATLELGYGARFSLPFRRPDCTLSRFRFSSLRREYDRLVIWSIATPEQGFPGHHLRSSGLPLYSLRPWMCRHTREPTVLSRVSSVAQCHLNFDRFHKPCLLTWRTPSLPRTTPVPRGDLLSLCSGSPIFRPLRLTGGTYQAD